eukprot:CAMPEP_0174849612 /NCGR_PEP_ID=MMETSP1114-20130205/16664_1 /TAXON_ID=312471 /ORGANISM="Neobodo designis, Strain CCAP 1951/1" /LENGTH=227 /DNA_ID=CAMNT_0016083987 /DNA_START=176 /DNA_END=859 /DNA_ORIENTATION=-
MQHSTPLPPAPRSRQIAEAQAAQAAGLPAQLPPPRPAPTTPTALRSGPASANGTAFPPSAHSAPNAKPKVCRNFKLGNACPYEDRCAFAHVDDQVSTAGSVSEPSPLPPGANGPHGHHASARGLSHYGSMGSMDFAALQQQPSGAYSPHDGTPVNSYFPDGSVEDFAPPSYEAFITNAGSGPAPSMPFQQPAHHHRSGSDSPTDSPPTPMRYRHNPYGFDGLIVKFL